MKPLNLNTILVIVIITLLFFVWALGEMQKNNIYCYKEYAYNQVKAEYCGTLEQLKREHPEIWKPDDIKIDRSG
jgi:hypothetical protein